MQQDERGGIAIALAGFALLSVGDAVIKTMAGEWSPLAVAALRFFIGAVGLSSLLLVREGAEAFRPLKPWLQAARGFCLAGATLAFFSAIFVMPLAEAMALAFVAPVFTALFSGPLLKEKVRPAVWIASPVALAGVLIILRPNLAELGWVAVLPLIAAFFMSLVVITNRASAGQGSALSMQVYMAVGAFPVLLIAALVGAASGVEALAISAPDWTIAARCAFVALTASTAHFLTYVGTERAGAAVIAPCTYIQILVASFFGWWWFGDLPDLVTVLGAAIIIAAGIFLWRSSPARQPMPR
ncbi:DMT family transporter [Qipengyuania atrilutea]|uniref:DMT family transporter n=1 Tax=Qipengyuania atrilutea TaxID=2744473 RepID=A0A850H783_9SPHN|nr:DMT family transporter [Actirhodobacter atriluteus]NVD45663.1 DMT family transporter [Actirhodobacter atriluteus]